jgi:hypothetical protein
VQAQTGRKITMSAVHATLYRLEEKGYLASHMGGTTKKEVAEGNDFSPSRLLVRMLCRKFRRFEASSGNPFLQVRFKYLAFNLPFEKATNLWLLIKIICIRPA